MQQSPLTLRQRLIDAVDESYHVKDMGEIVAVLSTLEVLPVTKELLETTRLGKTVNEFRKRIDDEKLAKRAKALVKKWRDAVLVTDPSPATGLLSQSTSGRPLNGNSDGVQMLSSSLSNHSGPLRTGYSSNSSSPKLMPSFPSKVSPSVLYSSNSLSPRILSNLTSNSNNNLSRNGQSQSRPSVSFEVSSPGLSSSSPSLRISSPSQYGNKGKSSFGSTSSPQMQLINKSLSNTNSYAPNVEIVARTNAANKRLRIEDSGDPTATAVGPPPKKARTIANGGISEGTLDDPSIILDELSKDSITSRTSENSDGSSSKPVSNISSGAVLSAAPSPNSVMLDSTAASPMSLGGGNGVECSEALLDDDNKIVFPLFMENEVSSSDLGANISNDQPHNASDVGQPPKRGRKRKQTNVIDAETLLHQQIAQAQQESKIRTVHRLSMEVFEEEHSRPYDSGTEHGQKIYSPVFTREPVIKSEIVEKYLLSQNELRTKMERQYQDAVDRNEIPLVPDQPSRPLVDNEAGDELNTKKKKKKDRKKYSAWQSFPSESEILSRLPPIDPKILEELKNFQFDVPSESEEAKSKAEIETEIPTSLTTTNETTSVESKNTESRIPSKIDWGDSDDEDASTAHDGSADSIVDIELASKISTSAIASADQSATSPMSTDISSTQDEEQEKDEQPVVKEIEDSDVDRLHLEKVENLNGNTDKDGQFKEWHEVLGVESFKGDLLHILPYTIIDF